MIITLTRDIWTANETCGWLQINGRKWSTIERAWVPSVRTPAGTKGVSCVGLGEYRLEPHTGEGFQNVWALVNPALDIYHWDWDVPASKKGTARTVCLIHPANWAHELRGCIAPGKERVKESTGYWKVARSRDAVNEIRNAFGVTIDLRLVIVDGRAT
jgi:hypothetical protein